MVFVNWKSPQASCICITDVLFKDDLLMGMQKSFVSIDC